MYIDRPEGKILATDDKVFSSREEAHQAVADMKREDEFLAQAQLSIVFVGSI